MNWQQQADTLILERRYIEAANLYEKAITSEPEVITYYWYLGLLYLLLNQEEEAQQTWLLAMSQGTSEEVEAWTQELIQILDKEAQRQVNQANLQASWIIRQQIRDIDPTWVNNLLHLIQLSLSLEIFSPELLREWQFTETLHTASSKTVDSALLLAVTANLATLHLNLEEIYQQSLRISSELNTLVEQNQQTLHSLFPELPLSKDPIYYRWLIRNCPRPSDLEKMAEIVKTLAYKPLISIIVPTFNTPELFLREALDSVLEQVYPYWELCIADDASTEAHVKITLQEYLARDSRIKVNFRQTNGHISRCSNSALEMATGDFIALLDHDDILTPDALFEVVSLLNRYPDADMIYSDEDQIDEDETLIYPYFKPDWCPDSFLSRMYTCHLGVYRRSLINQIGGFRVGYEGAQDYDLVLRFTENTEKIYHIPKILYHWRLHSQSASASLTAKPYAYEAGHKALTDALARRRIKGKVTEKPDLVGSYIVRYEILQEDLVSIIIPTRDLGNILDRCLESIFEKTSYSHYEVIVIDNGSTQEETFRVINRWTIKEPNRFKCYKLDIPFNYSIINNYAVKQAQGKYLLFLNNDTEVLTSDWIEAMVEQAQRPSIGAVGALLLYPNNLIQHAGVVMGIKGVAGHSHRCFPVTARGYRRQIQTVNNYSAITAACLMCRQDVFEKVGGFNEELTVAFNDIDLCLKMINKGYRNIYLPHVILYHHESISRGYENTPEKQARFIKEVKYMQARWQEFIVNDPCYNIHLTKAREDYSLNV